MTDLRTAAQQALEALLNFPDDISDAMFESITALKAALAQEQAEAHTTTLRALLERCLSWEPDACVLGNVTAQDAAAALRAALAQQDEPVQEPAYKVEIAGRWHDAEPLPPAFSLPDGEHLLYAAPPQRKPLPKHDQHCVDVPGYGLMAVRLVRAVERAHGIKE